MDGKRYELVWKVFSVNKWKCSVARFTRAEGGAKRKALARRRSAAALDRHRTLGSTKKDPRHQGISRNPVAEGAPESIAPSAEGGPDSRSCLNFDVRKVYCAEHREPLQSTKTRTSSSFDLNRYCASQKQTKPTSIAKVAKWNVAD